MAGYSSSFPSSWTILDTPEEHDSSRSTPTPPTPPTPSVSSVSSFTADILELSLPPVQTATPNNNTQASNFSLHFPSSWLLSPSNSSPPGPGSGPNSTATQHWGRPQRATTVIGDIGPSSQTPRHKLCKAQSFSGNKNRSEYHRNLLLPLLKEKLTGHAELVPWPNRQEQEINHGVDTASSGRIGILQAETTRWDNRRAEKQYSALPEAHHGRMSPYDTNTFTSSSYTIACICPMGLELAAVKGMLEKEHTSLPMTHNRNSYTLGEMGGHKVVVAVMPAIGENVAAVVVTQLLNDFPSVRFGLLVGIGGGIPVKHEHDIRLGDVVVGTPTRTSSSVVQFDQGKIHAGGNFERTGTLNKPPAVLMAHLHKLQAQHLIDGTSIPQYLEEMLQSHPMMDKKQWTYQGFEQDLLFDASYAHQGDQRCDNCDKSWLISREPRRSHIPHIHYGTIGSSNLVVKDALARERLRKEFGIICVEMEAAGLVDEFPCLVIRGVCDYADSHKNKQWQPYAAATAAAFAKEFLSTIPI